MSLKNMHHTLKYQLHPQALPNSGVDLVYCVTRHQYICHAKFSSSISSNQSISGKKKKNNLTEKNNESKMMF